MSPTATIATVIVALVFFAWLFQTPTRDPGYEAWRKRQAEQAKRDESLRDAAGAVVTDPKVSSDPRSLEELQRERERQRAGSPGATPFVAIPDPDADPFRGVPLSVSDGTGQVMPPDALRRPAPPQVDRDAAFPNNHVLSGTYVGVAYDGDRPKESAKGEEPTITFRRDGTFSTHNMGAAEVDMEAATALGASIDHGSGRYKISGRDLELNYTDGLTRKKGNKRSYVIVPIGGPDDAPAGITIQGKLFRLDPHR